MSMPSGPNPKSTPNRRPCPTGRNGSSGAKAYVSENDAATYKHAKAVSPSTPQKHMPNGNAAPKTRSQSANQKQKNKSNKNRSNKNGAASPGRRQDRESPPLQSQEALAPIFAGSTFHASPAPSALPLPRFLVMSNTDSPTAKAKLESPPRESSPSTGSEEAGPVTEPLRRNEDSPLEFFFRADRAEKARVRRASSANAGTITTAGFSPLQDSYHTECNTLPRAIVPNPLRRQVFMEGETSPGLVTNAPAGGSRPPVGPAFSTPYQERIRAARSNPNSAQPTRMANQTLDPTSSEALKRYLFTGQLGPSKPQDLSPRSSPSRDPRHNVAQRQQRSGGRQQSAYPGPQPPPFPNPISAPELSPAPVFTGHTPRAQPASYDSANTRPSAQSEHILALEGDLRRILKLDSQGQAPRQL
ncbi:hypothetical protein F4802DRAFT_547805 [Xylaria palmicola]|nr:hypothetical protein F4802DRAFT_547805 [Xylaria palmicola]